MYIGHVPIRAVIGSKYEFYWEKQKAFERFWSRIRYDDLDYIRLHLSNELSPQKREKTCEFVIFDLILHFEKEYVVSFWGCAVRTSFEESLVPITALIGTRLIIS